MTAISTGRKSSARPRKHTITRGIVKRGYAGVKICAATTKRSYATQAEAEHALESANLARTASLVKDEFTEKRAYFCNPCEGWHLTHLSKEEWTARKEEFRRKNTPSEEEQQERIARRRARFLTLHVLADDPDDKIVQNNIIKEMRNQRGYAPGVSNLLHSLGYYISQDYPARNTLTNQQKLFIAMEFSKTLLIDDPLRLVIANAISNILDSGNFEGSNADTVELSLDVVYPKVSEFLRI